MNTVYQSSFEEGFYDYQGTGELTCPNGWTPAWVQGPGGGVLHRPEYDAKDRDLGQPEVRTGRFAANFFTVFATHDGCLYRQFRVGSSKLVRASAWCMNVSFSQDGKDGGHGMQIGIDPTGGTDHTAQAVVYGEWWSTYMDEWKEREWYQVTAEAVSESDVITVFLHSKSDYASDISASHWDDFALELGDPAEAAAPPEPTAQPAAAQGGFPTLEQIEEVVRRVFREELERLRGG